MIELVRLLTEEQKLLLTDIEYANGMFFNPIQDINNNWIISEEEVSQCVNQTVIWVKTLPLIDWIPPIYDDIY